MCAQNPNRNNEYLIYVNWIILHLMKRLKNNLNGGIIDGIPSFDVGAEVDSTDTITNDTNDTKIGCIGNYYLDLCDVDGSGGSDINHDIFCEKNHNYNYNNRNNGNTSDTQKKTNVAITIPFFPVSIFIITKQKIKVDDIMH